MTIGARIKKLRRSLDLTQQEFAERIGIKRNTIAKYETGRGDPIDAVNSLICREFNVSEVWLRTGEGQMFVEVPRNEALAAQIQAFLQGGTDSFRERLISLLLRLTPEQWDALEGYLLELIGPRAATTDAADALPAFSPEDEAEADKFSALAREQYLSEKQQASPASSASKSAEKPA